MKHLFNVFLILFFLATLLFGCAEEGVKSQSRLSTSSDGNHPDTTSAKHSLMDSSRLTFPRFEGFDTYDTMISSPLSIIVYDDVVYIFGQSADNRVWVTKKEENWSEWASLEGCIYGAPSPIVLANELHLVARGCDSSVQHRYFDGENWSEWQSLSHQIEYTPMAFVKNDKLQIYVVGIDKALWVMTLAGSEFVDEPWVYLGGAITSPPRVINWGSSVQVFQRYIDASLRAAVISDDGASDFASLGGNLTSAPSVFTYGNTIQIFARGYDDGVYQSMFDGTDWHYWEGSLGAPGGDYVLTSPTAMAYGESIWLFATTQAGNNYVKTWSPWNPESKWTAWNLFQEGVGTSFQTAMDGETAWLVTTNLEKQPIVKSFDGTSWTSSAP